MRPLILASGSRYRAELLGRLGLSFEAVPADVDESRRPGESPRALAVRLAESKARVVAADHPDAWVIGSDQVIAVDDEVLSKPGSVERAVKQLVKLSGREHRLLTAVHIVAPHREASSVATFAMKMRSFDAQEAAAYVDEEQPLDCAGSYRIESAGIRLFEYLRGDDYTAIIGLSLTDVWRLLRETGYFDVQD